MSKSDPVNLAVVVPFFNEELGAAPFLDRLRQALVKIEESGEIALDWRVICVNDGSRDQTLSALLGVHRAEPRIAVVETDWVVPRMRREPATAYGRTGDRDDRSPPPQRCEVTRSCPSSTTPSGSGP